PPGYEGTSSPPWTATSDFSDQMWTKALCHAIVKLIDDEKLDRPIIVGHHMLGDYYALRIGIDHPDKIRGVIIVAGKPSTAYPAVGKNKPGQPITTASLEERLQMMKKFAMPFYKNVTAKMWKAGSFQPRTFCRNSIRAQQLFDQQVAVPIPTQVRYLLEYLTADLELELPKLSVPLLTVISKPEKELTLDDILQNGKESNIMMYGDLDKARVAWTKRLT